MNPRNVKTISDAKRIIEKRNLSHVKVGLFDNDGVMRGKYMSREKFFSSLDNGFTFCDVVLGWDSKDQLFSHHWIMALHFVTWYWAGIPKISCTIMSLIPAGTQATPMPLSK